jgi:trans-2,3-dihydro-3-hydroxyanthranilate isomerase
MRRYRFVTLDVFTDTRFGGNPLAVFPDARGMSDAEMQALAAEFNLSETTFVLPPEDPANTARVRIFTPKVEMPFAGHPNVGTGFVVATERGGDRLRFEEPAGIVGISIARDASGAVSRADIAAPQPLSFGSAFTPEQLAPCASLTPGDVVTARHAPVSASLGNPFVLMQVTPEALARAAPDESAFRQVMASGVVQRLAIYLYALGGGGVRARMFGPGLGVKEDAATGSAAVVLAAMLLHLDGGERGAWDIVQGVEMGRPSLLRTTATRGADGIRATVGGGCVRVMEGEAFL